MLSSPVAFVDTGFWIAFLIRRDALHDKAHALFREVTARKASLVCTSAVLVETLDGLASHGVRYQSSVLRQVVAQSQRLEVIHIDEALFARGWDLYQSRTDKSWSLTDCLSFVVMQQRNITDALAHDHHFEQAGFRALLRD